MSGFRTLLAATALFAAPAAAWAADPPGLIDVLHHFAHAISGSDADDFSRLFAPDATITDTVYPYHWQGSDAAKHYFSDLQEDVKSVGWEHMRLSPEGDPFVVARPGFAYAALHLSVDYRVHHEEHHDKGIFTLSLTQDGSHWKINTATWTYTQPPGFETEEHHDHADHH